MFNLTMECIPWILHMLCLHIIMIKKKFKFLDALEGNNKELYLKEKLPSGALCLKTQATTAPCHSIQDRAPWWLSRQSCGLSRTRLGRVLALIATHTHTHTQNHANAHVQGDLDESANTTTRAHRLIICHGSKPMIDWV